MSKIFENLLKNELYMKLLEQLPEEEREATIESLRKFTEEFEQKIIEPIRKLKNK